MLYVTEINTEINWNLKMIVFGSGLFIYYIIHFEPPRGRLKDYYRMTKPPRGVRDPKNV